MESIVPRRSCRTERAQTGCARFRLSLPMGLSTGTDAGHASRLLGKCGEARRGVKTWIPRTGKTSKGYYRMGYTDIRRMLVQCRAPVLGSPTAHTPGSSTRWQWMRGGWPLELRVGDARVR